MLGHAIVVEWLGVVCTIAMTRFDVHFPIHPDPQQPVAVEEPSPAEAVTWLHGLRGRYERYHGVRYSDAALGAGKCSADMGRMPLLHFCGLGSCDGPSCLAHLFLKQSAHPSLTSSGYPLLVQR